MLPSSRPASAPPICVPFCERSPGKPRVDATQELLLEDGRDVLLLLCFALL